MATNLSGRVPPVAMMASRLLMCRQILTVEDTANDQLNVCSLTINSPRILEAVFSLLCNVEVFASPFESTTMAMLVYGLPMLLQTSVFRRIRNPFGKVHNSSFSTPEKSKYDVENSHHLERINANEWWASAARDYINSINLHTTFTNYCTLFRSVLRKIALS
jgi:hypothetical protein